VTRNRLSRFTKVAGISLAEIFIESTGDILYGKAFPFSAKALVE